MRIAIVLSGLGAGGAERVAAILARTWAERRWEIVVLCFEREGATPYHTLPQSVRILRHAPPPRGSKMRAAAALLGRLGFLRRTLKREAPDVVVSFLTKVNVQTLLATRGLDLPVIACERNNPALQAVRPIWRRLQERLVSRATLVLQTEASRAAFANARPRALRVIPNAVDPVAHRADPSLRRLVAVGRLVEQKRFDRLLKAFATIAPRYPDWRLVICGEGPCRPALERLRDDLGLAARVDLPGVTPVPHAWITAGSVFVLSSAYEGFPNVLVEAMSAGMPVVSFDCPFGPSEIVLDGQDGLLVPPGDVEALARALDRIMGNEDFRSRAGEAGRRNVVRFATARVLAAWDDAIAVALRTRRLSPDMISVEPAVERIRP